MVICSGTGLTGAFQEISFLLIFLFRSCSQLQLPILVQHGDGLKIRA
jgi:hypothetical protein